jgi:hypothetical protein
MLAGPGAVVVVLGGNVVSTIDGCASKSALEVGENALIGVVAAVVRASARACWCHVFAPAATAPAGNAGGDDGNEAAGRDEAGVAGPMQSGATDAYVIAADVAVSGAEVDLGDHSPGPAVDRRTARRAVRRAPRHERAATVTATHDLFVNRTTPTGQR